MEHDSSALVFALDEARKKLPELLRPLIDRAVAAILERDRHIHTLQRELEFERRVHPMPQHLAHLPEVIR